MPLIGNRIKSKKTGKSGIKNRITSLFTLFQRAYAKTALEKGSLSTGPICYTTADARKPKQRLSGLVPTTQTPLRTAFHDTQRLLLEVYISNVRSVFVFFAPLMKK
ncbi:hypothetical protein [[Clostridium] scindens]|uniref:hypothetical protein n=1 Tax=Clostridium scindens (strain JCM 10418 / VPI 12708) TaxID=29347 RepID=UPI002A834303|nr:hypothetical protein [[Clostridium] scindens]